MASPIPSPPPEPASDAQASPPPPPPPTPSPPPQNQTVSPSPISPENLGPPASAAVTPPTTTPSPNHSGDSSSPMPSQTPAPPPPPTTDPSPPLPRENGTPQSRPLPPPAPASLAPPSPPAPASPESMMDGEAAEATGELENMTLALALAQTEEATPPMPPKAAEPMESPAGSPHKESALTIAKLLSGEDAAVMEAKPVADKVASPVTTASVVVGGGGGVGSKRWLLGGVPEKVRRAELRRAELGFRVAAAVFCLVSLSVMAADTTPGWSGDSFRRYNEYRYTLAASVLAFTYSGFQLVVEVHYLVTGKRLIRDPWAKYFSLAMDQTLAYLLLSASSATLSRNDVWVSRFGVDQFAKLIDASASMAFLAFVALGLSSIISAYNVFSSVF
ncbi:hypothetical protein ABZP36_017278 [Zizania latifolia]